MVGHPPACGAWYAVAMMHRRLRRTAIVTTCLALFACTASCGKADAQADAKKRLADLRAQMNAEMEKEIAAGGIDPAKQAERERLYKVEMQKAMGAADSEGQEVLQSTMKLMQDLQKEMTPYNQRTDTIGDLLDPAKLSTKEGLDKAEAELAWIVGESKRLEGVVAQLPAMLQRAVLGMSGTTERDVQAALKASKLDRMQPVLLTIRTCDTRTWETWQSRLRLMKAELGKWKHDAAAGTIEFEREAANAEFNATADALDAIAKEQLEAQKQMVAIQKD